MMESEKVLVKKQDDFDSIEEERSYEAAPISMVNFNGHFSLSPAIEQPMIHNIVATANLCCKLDLTRIVSRVRNTEYNPKRFRAVIMRIFDPRTTAMIFSSGKIVCTGAKSERLACVAARKYGRIIQKLGYEVCSKMQLFIDF